MKKFDIRNYGYYKILIEVNNVCNMHCSFCSLAISKLPKRFMDKERVFMILDSLSQYEGIEWVTFPQFGEPLLNENIWDYIDKCRSLNLKSQLVTNGSLFTEENIDNLCNHCPDSLQISLQILDPEKYLENRKCDVPFSVYLDRIAACLARFIDHKPQIAEIHTDLSFNWDNYLGSIGVKRR